MLGRVVMTAPPTPSAPAAKHGFSVGARTILELGAELISSDAIALYELIKNAYDAKSKRVTIRVTNVFRHSSIRNMDQRIGAAIATCSTDGGLEPDLLVKLVGEVVSLVDLTAAPADREAFVLQVKSALNLTRLRRAMWDGYKTLNRIEIIDTGDGMSLTDLQEVFLRIGTRSRLESDGSHHYVGGKGIGRLSTMRLADHLTVITTKKGEARRSILEIDWNRFSHASAELLEDVDIRPAPGDLKEDTSEQGTTIVLSALKADWDHGRVDRMARRQLDRLFDPFGTKPRYPIVIEVNGVPVRIPTFDRRLLEEAQAKVTVNYFIDASYQPNFSFTIEYLAYNRTLTVVWTEADILGITSEEDVSLASMRAVGPFTAQFHWFNRQKLSKVDGVGTRAEVRDMVNHWANGLLMYRDGFRVNPYGAPDDDWLGIDVKALGSSGYKVNRKQLIGAVNITAVGNPLLIDQTNREGLRSNEERTIMTVLMRKLITEDFRNFLNAVERQEKAKKTLDAKDTTVFLDTVSGRVRATLKKLTALVDPAAREDVQFLDATFVELEERLKTARDAITSAEREQRDLVNLAGIGLLVEIVSHELGRVARRTLELVTGLERRSLPPAVLATFDVVESQMLVIRRRLDMLDPLSPSGRNRKEKFDLRALVSDVLASHQNQFERFGIAPSFEMEPPSDDAFMVKAVKGMIVQILENLIDNSVFWLRQQSRADPSFRPSLSIVIDTETSQLQVSDNGPGISVSRAEEVFRPFVSSKPPGEGKGLGLYISREIARYHGSDLTLLDAPRNGRLTTFVLDIDGLQ